LTTRTASAKDWSHRYKRTIEVLHSLKVKSAYLDGELCALNAEGVPAFSRLQAAMDEGRTDQLVFFAFDLLYPNGKSTAQLPLIKRKERLERLPQGRPAASGPHSGAGSFLGAGLPRAAVYIDGFNFFHAVDELRTVDGLEENHLKWLDLWALSAHLVGKRRDFRCFPLLATYALKWRFSSENQFEE
jgi:hypothetical protein